jgi:prepilin-type N-terminal cleavage/methylation domain-containing protein/prepilin-type processing-associated H-X9-DG protein
MNHFNGYRKTSRRALAARPDAGFTLIELLIVIAIIAILASILFPVFARARENARRSSCSSNLRQLGLAFAQYTQDYDERLPGAVDGPDGATAPLRKAGWMDYSVFGSGTGAANVNPVFNPDQGTLYSYTKNVQIYVCSSDTEGQITKNSYAANACVFVKEKDGSTPPKSVLPVGYRIGKHLASFVNPTEWMLLSEEARDNTRPTTSTDDAYLNLRFPGDPTSFDNYFVRRHFEGANLAFLDGHVKWYGLNSIVSGKFMIGADPTLNLADGCPQ